MSSIAGRAGAQHRAHQATLVLAWLPLLSSILLLVLLLAVGRGAAALGLVAVLRLLWVAAVLRLLLMAVLGRVFLLGRWVLLAAAVALVLLLRGACVLVVLLLRRGVVTALVVGGRTVALEVRECQPCSASEEGDMAYLLLRVVALLSVALATVLVLLVAAAAVVIVGRHDVLVVILFLFGKTDR